jgi:hypothetical protein
MIECHLLAVSEKISPEVEIISDTWVHRCRLASIRPRCGLLREKAESVSEIIFLEEK